MTRPRPDTTVGPNPQGDLRRLVADLGEMLGARRKLAELELRADVSTSKRLAWTAGIGAVLILTGLSVIVVYLSQLLQAWRPVGSQAVNGWGPILAGSLIFLGLISAWAGYRRFRRDFMGLRRSLTELREDIQWLREWTGGDDA